MGVLIFRCDKKAWLAGIYTIIRNIQIESESSSCILNSMSRTLELQLKSNRSLYCVDLFIGAIPIHCANHHTLFNSSQEEGKTQVEVEQ